MLFRSNEELKKEDGWYKLPLDFPKFSNLRIDDQDVITAIPEEELEAKRKKVAQDDFKSMLLGQSEAIISPYRWTQLPVSRERNGDEWADRWKNYILDVKSVAENYDVANSDLSMASVVWPTPPSE